MMTNAIVFFAGVFIWAVVLKVSLKFWVISPANPGAGWTVGSEPASNQKQSTERSFDEYLYVLNSNILFCIDRLRKMQFVTPLHPSCRFATPCMKNLLFIGQWVKDVVDPERGYCRHSVRQIAILMNAS